VRNCIDQSMASRLSQKSNKGKFYDEVFLQLRADIERDAHEQLVSIGAGNYKLHLVDARSYLSPPSHHDEEVLAKNILQGLPVGRGDNSTEEQLKEAEVNIRTQADELTRDMVDIDLSQ
jgi:hypothetical protein